jgi:DNA polymerase I
VRFATLEALYEDLEEVARLPLRGAAGLAIRLRAHREAAFLARSLTRIHCDAPLAADYESLRRRSPELAAVAGFCSRHGFGALLSRQAERIATAVAAAASGAQPLRAS